jgi:ATP-dependent helicase/nuclease subunit A
MSNLPLPFEAPAPPSPPADERDRLARAFAVDPRVNVALEASAGTGKTRVLVERYVNLLRAGVDPANILAMTFTRKAAGEMRERILASLQTAALRGELTPARWRALRDRTGDIAISTIDAFCLSLLREFPLEADLDPGFSIADDAEVPRLVDESLDRTLRICRAIARDDEQVALVFAQLGDWRARSGLASLLARRLVAPALLARFLARARPGITVAGAAEAARGALLDLFAAMTPEEAGDDGPEGGLRAFAMSGPADPTFMLLVQAMETLASAGRRGEPADARRVHAALARARAYFLTQRGEPRARPTRPRALFPSDAHWRRHRDLVVRHAPAVADAWRAYRHDMNVLVAGGVWRMFRIAEAEYRRTLDARAALDFSDLLARTLDMLRRMEEFARSRYRLESRYHHVLVDEFQDTSRAQWELVSLLVDSWGEGAGLASSGPLPPSIFIVGDRKQSIYGFRDADVSVLGDAVRFLRGLRPDEDVRRSISRSFRAQPPLLAFVNDVCADVEKVVGRADAFEYGEDDRFPVDDQGDRAVGSDPLVGFVPAASAQGCARLVAAEIARLVQARTPVRDVSTGVYRDMRPGDVAILFRTRESHRVFEESLAAAGLPSYVYKGLGFFESDEIRDVLALLGFLAEPASSLRAAALLRSGFARVSDEALRRLAPDLAAALIAAAPPAPDPPLDPPDAAVLQLAREMVCRLRGLVDRIAPAELLDLALSETAYALDTRGPRGRQAWENLKKIRGLVRRLQNAGYATLERIVTHFDQMAVGDESNAAIDARDAVNLMTVHAAKGLEFPVVFVVNLGVGTGRRRPPIRVAGRTDGEVSVSIGDFRDAADEDADAQDREETKRLLYVALTRARDRLYLSAVTRDGRIEPGRGSLAEVMPPSLVAQFSAPGASGAWQASGGRHPFRLVSEIAPSAETSGLSDAAAEKEEEATEDFGPLPSSEPTTAPLSGADHLDAGPKASDVHRLFGSLVHRLVHRAGLAADGREAPPCPQLTNLVLQLVRPDEHASVADPEQLAEAVAQYYQRLCARDDVRALVARGQALHEVPFTMMSGGVRQRGTIDCVILATSAAGAVPLRVTVLEFKTGRAHARDREQAEFYRRAASALFPGAQVTAAVVYDDFVETL